jgi:hypothetical protein
MDPRAGHFLGADPFLGDTNEPATLHRYLYCSNDPVNRVDPSGRLSNLIFGRRVHKIIGDHFEPLGFDRLADRGIAVVLGLNIPWWDGGWLRPDLVDRQPWANAGPITNVDIAEVWEIKPLGSFLEGEAQLALYLDLLSELDPQERDWRSGSSATYDPTPLNPIVLSNVAVAVVFPSVYGVIIYNVVSVADLAEEMAAAAAATTSIAVALALTGTAASGTVAATVAGTTAVTATSATILAFPSAAGAAAAGGALQGAGVTLGASTATLTGSMGMGIAA